MSSSNKQWWRRAAVVLGGFAVVAASSLVMVPASAEDDSGVARSSAVPDQPPRAWRGTLRVEYDVDQTIWDAVAFHDRFSADLVDVRMQENGLDNGEPTDGYGAASSVLSFEQELRGDCVDGGFGVREYSPPWSFEGPLEGGVDSSGRDVGFNGGVAFRLRDLASGTQFEPQLLGFTSKQLVGCSGYAGVAYPPGFQGQIGFVFPSSKAEVLLNDTDPDPLHLVGSTSFDLGSIPGSWNRDAIKWTKFDYTVSYDLRRDVAPKPPAGPECSNGVDDDLDGVVDAGVDPGCTGADDVSELGSAACDNGLDDDGDGRIDFRPNGSSGGDPDCGNPSDTNEGSYCISSDPKSQTYKTETKLPKLPGIHWFTSTVEVKTCTTATGVTRIRSVKVDRQVESGPVPSAISLVGWSAKADPEVAFTPSGGRVFGDEVVFDDPPLSASARIGYTACFDFLLLFDKFGLKDKLAKTMAKPMKAGIKAALRKARVKTINPQVRSRVLSAVNKTIDKTFAPGTISGFLQRRLVPWPVAKLAELASGTQQDRVEALFQSTVLQAMESGAYDDLVVGEVVDRVIDDGMGEILGLSSFCGGVDAAAEHLRLLDTTVTVYGGVKGIDFDIADTYSHPIMRTHEE